MVGMSDADRDKKKKKKIYKVNAAGSQDPFAVPLPAAIVVTVRLFAHLP